jgi:ribonuclease-3
MNPIEELRKRIPEIEERIGYTFNDKSFLELAFIHRSFTNENRSIVQGHNERLEFLGDAVLGLLVSNFLYLHLPKNPEGELSYLRSRLVEAFSCARYLMSLKLEPFVLMGRGESMNEGKGRTTVLADLFEALIGAIYLDGGMDSAHRFFFEHFRDDVLQIIEKPHRNWKAELQDYSQKIYQTPPEYVVIREAGPDHMKMFTIAVRVGGEEVGQGAGSSKKEAEQQAAERGIERLGI